MTITTYLINRFLIFFTFFNTLFFAHSLAQNYFTAEEINVIHRQPIAYVLQTDIFTDSVILTTQSNDINITDSNLYDLQQLLVKTVTDSANDGVGIAAPQIGINRNIFLIQRFDKENQPFEMIINPTIEQVGEYYSKGPEGCLSIKGIRADVYRYNRIVVSYYNIKGKFIRETIEGFTAIIFQHEYDHLKGILFTSRIQEQSKIQYKNVSNKFNSNIYIKN